MLMEYYGIANKDLGSLLILYTLILYTKYDFNKIKSLHIIIVQILQRGAARRVCMAPAAKWSFARAKK